MSDEQITHDTTEVDAYTAPAIADVRDDGDAAGTQPRAPTPVLEQEPEPEQGPEPEQELVQEEQVKPEPRTSNVARDEFTDAAFAAMDDTDDEVDQVETAAKSQERSQERPKTTPQKRMKKSELAEAIAARSDMPAKALMRKYKKAQLQTMWEQIQNAPQQEAKSAQQEAASKTDSTSRDEYVPKAERAKPQQASNVDAGEHAMNEIEIEAAMMLFQGGTGLMEVALNAYCQKKWGQNMADGFTAAHMEKEAMYREMLRRIQKSDPEFVRSIALDPRYMLALGFANTSLGFFVTQRKKLAAA